jgi:hypothetical protein
MNDPIASYTFLPWLRQGIASRITGEDSLGKLPGPVERASVRISLQVNGDPDFVRQDVQLTGPGDVIGISPRAVVRVEPRPWVADFEPNYLAFIEFYEEDFPWRFTPARAARQSLAGNTSSDPRQAKLRPWIFLLVLEEGEFIEQPAGAAPLPSVRLTGPADALLPPAEQAWAWAHVHVSKDILPEDPNDLAQTLANLESLLARNPDHAYARLVSPRKLRPSTGYHACLVPAFETGRLAGLGRSTEGVDALAPAWGAGQVEFPVYYRWFFRTGLRGDFEYLARLLQPGRADERVGIRDMDMQDPGFGVPGMGAGPDDLPVMGLEGSLKSPSARPRPAAWPPRNRDRYPPFLNELEVVVNLQETLLRPPGQGGHPDPIISPPLYGRWHALQERLNVGRPGWVNELNQDPRLRVPAGFGTQVVQAGQEEYVRRSWQQLGDLLQANQKIRQAQAAIAAGERLFTRHFASLAPEQQVAVTRQVHARVMANPNTVFQLVRERRLEQAAVQPAFRRVLRPRGTILRRAFERQPVEPGAFLEKINAGDIAAAPPKEASRRQIALTRIADKLNSERLREDNLRVDVVRRIEANPFFRFTLPGSRDILDEPLGPLAVDSEEGRNFRSALLDLHDRLEIALPAPDPRPALSFRTAGAVLEQALRPKNAIRRRLASVLSIPPRFRSQQPKTILEPVMAHPVFADPMYRPLRDLSSELLIPNLDLIPNNTITLLETNPRFIEAYLVGLNHELARELLWREFPTDQRGSYFRQFWDVGDVVEREEGKDPRAVEEELRDVIPLHRWGRQSPLGTHQNRDLPSGGEPGEKKVVLVVRGDLLKRYQTAVIFAQAAEWVPDPNNIPRLKRELDDGDPVLTVRLPIFKAEIEPDLHFLGFDLMLSEARGRPDLPSQIEIDAGNPGPAGWFFVIQERPGEPRFGLDIADKSPGSPGSLARWNDLTWNHLGDPAAIPYIDLRPETMPSKTTPASRDEPGIRWGSNAADLAYILFQPPAMVAIHALNMLNEKAG